MKLAYLINQYPQPSQSFIRREIAALEVRGASIERFTLRQWDAALVDPGDIAELHRTRVVLHKGALALAGACLQMMARQPRKFFSAARTAWRLGKNGVRGRPVHLIYLAEACVLVEWFTETGVEHVHAHFGTNSATVAMLCRLLGGPGYSFTVHGPEEFDQPIALALGEKVARSEFVVAVSEFGRSQLYRWCAACDWPKVHVVRCGVDESFLQSARQITGGQPSPPPASVRRLVCVARLSEQKGQLVLLEAAAELRRRKIDFDLLLIGDGPMRGDIEREIARLGLLSCVKLAGWLPNDRVRQEMLGARAVVLPSFAEGLPVVLMEALALGRPVVSTHVAGIPELVDWRCGYLVAPGNVEALADALAQVLAAEDAEIRVMAAHGAQRVLQNHDVSHQAQKLEGLFLASRKSPLAAVTTDVRLSSDS